MYESSVLEIPMENRETEYTEVRLVSNAQRFLDTIFGIFGCVSHEWSFPITFKSRFYPEGFDSHQTCTECGKSRYYSFERTVPGDYFIDKG